MEVFEQIKRLRSSTLIKERSFGRVSSFNFTKKAFFDSKWNELTTRARGLFIDTENGKIVARGYDKFFNLDENQNNKRSVLKKKLAFPVHAYRKENGFLGLIYWEEEYHRIRFATKSSLDGPYVQMLEEAFWDTVKYPIEVINVLRGRVLSSYHYPHHNSLSRLYHTKTSFAININRVTGDGALLISKTAPSRFL